jgi:hypothetical protein
LAGRFHGVLISTACINSSFLRFHSRINRAAPLHFARRDKPAATGGWRSLRAAIGVQLLGILINYGYEEE